MHDCAPKPGLPLPPRPLRWRCRSWSRNAGWSGESKKEEAEVQGYYGKHSLEPSSNIGSKQAERVLGTQRDLMAKEFNRGA